MVIIVIIVVIAISNSSKYGPGLLELEIANIQEQRGMGWRQSSVSRAHPQTHTRAPL